jgi:urate oxidase
MIELGRNRYGKSAIRLVRVDRSGDPHRVYDLTIDIALEGEFAAAYVDGENAAVIATDTMKNTAYAFAREHLTGSIEAYGLALARHFLEAEQVSAANVGIRAAGWGSIGRHRDAFLRDGSYLRTAQVTAARRGTTVDSGVADLVVLKTGRSAFTGFPRDQYTTLPEASDRLMATKLTATWQYADEKVDFDGCFESILETLLESFAEHDSQSVQHSIWVMGQAILERHDEVDEVSMRLPNLHHWLVDLAPFGQENAGEVFVATREPHGLIEATVRRNTGTVATPAQG